MDALIHLRVPAATKGRWVRASRAADQRLSDYITCAVEAYMQHYRCIMELYTAEAPTAQR